MHSSTGFSSCRGGTFSKLLLFLLIFVGVITAAWIFFLPMILTSTLSKRTGFNVKVESLTFNPFGAAVHLEGLVIDNPSTFSRPDYLRVQTFQARAPFRTLFSDRPEFDYVLMDVTRITFVRNSDGTTNAGLFYDRLFPSDRPAPEDDKTKRSTRPTSNPAVKPLPQSIKTAPFLIRRLELKVAHVTWDDQYSKPAVTKDFNVGINQVFENVTDAKQLMTPAVMRTVAPAAAAIGGLIPGQLGQVFGAAAGTPAVRENAQKRGDSMKTMVDTLEESKKP